MIDLRWKIVRCCDCGKRYRCTPNADYYHAPAGRADATAENGRCWGCHLVLNGMAPAPEPRLGDPLFIVPGLS